MKDYEVDGPQALSRRGLCAWYGISEAQVTKLLDARVLPYLKIGTQIVVPVRSLEAYEEEIGRETARRLAQAGGGANV